MNLSHITPAQQTILTLLYRYRFLERKHIQQLLGHTNKSRTIRWLKDLREKGYIEWLYDAYNPATKSSSIPAIYFLSANGIRWLRQQGYLETELHKRHKDRERQPDFIDRCLLLADCCLHLQGRNNNTNDLVHYDYAVETDYLDPDSKYHFLAASECIRPNLVFTKAYREGDETMHQTYLVELFDITTPRYMVKKKLKSYIEFLDSDEWEEAQQKSSKLSDELPIILIACPALRDMIYAKRYIRQQLTNIWDDSIPEDVKLRVSTMDKIRTKGMTAVIWEQA